MQPGYVSRVTGKVITEKREKEEVGRVISRPTEMMK
jgi:hypothetical protein